jgi:Protein of unknown function (DUF2442)
MGTLAVELRPLAHSVNFTEDSMNVDLLDGRTISVPIAWFPTLSKASQSQKENWELLGDGEGIHWPEIDEDLSVSGLLAGAR